EEPRFDLPFLTFLVEVSLLASAALLSCLPALWPLVATAAWDGVHAVCCCLVPSLCGSGLLPAGSPVTALCLSECRKRRHLALQGLVVLTKDPSMVRRGQRLKLRWAKQPLGLAGLQELGKLLPALLPHLPQCFGTGLRPVGPAAAGWACSARALLAPSLVFRAGQKNLLGDRNGEVVSMTLSALLPLFDHVRLCAPSHGHWLLPRNFVDVQAFAQVGLGKLVLSDVAASLEGAPAFCSWPCQRHKSPLLWAVADLHVSPALQASQGEDVEDGQMPGKEGREAAASGWRRPLSAVLSVWAGSRPRALLQAPAGPSRAPMEPRPGGAAGRQRGSPGSSRASAPSRARCQRLLAGPQGCAGRGGRGGAQGAPGPGAEPAPTLPSCRSLQLAEDSSRAAEHLRRALPYLQSPQEPLREAAARFMGEPGARAPSPPRRSSAPAPPAAPAAPSGPGASGSPLPRQEGVWPQGRQRRWQGAVPGRALTGSVFPGMAGRYLKGQPAELRLLTQAGADRESCSAGQGAAIPWTRAGVGRAQRDFRDRSGTAQIPGPGTHRPLLRFSSMPSSAHAHRGRRADVAGKVPVLKVHFHNTVDLQILLSTLEPQESGRANLRIPWQASTQGRGAWNAGSFQEELPESSAVPHPCTGSGRGQKQRPSGLNRELWVCLRANEAAARCPRLEGATLPVPGALPGSAGMSAVVLVPASEEWQPQARSQEGTLPVSLGHGCKRAHAASSSACAAGLCSAFQSLLGRPGRCWLWALAGNNLVLVPGAQAGVEAGEEAVSSLCFLHLETHLGEYELELECLEAGARVPLWLSVLLSVLEARWTWQRGRGREKPVKSRFGIHLDLQRPSRAPAAACVSPPLDRGVSRTISVHLTELGWVGQAVWWRVLADLGVCLASQKAWKLCPPGCPAPWHSLCILESTRYPERSPALLLLAREHLSAVGMALAVSGVLGGHETAAPVPLGYSAVPGSHPASTSGCWPREALEAEAADLKLLQVPAGYSIPEGLPWSCLMPPTPCGTTSPRAQRELEKELARLLLILSQKPWVSRVVPAERRCSVGRMIQDPKAWQPELAAREGLGADPPECHPTARAGNQGVCWREGNSEEGRGELGGPGGMLRASVWCLQGVGVGGVLGKELSGR
ncbi:hypothetical protein DV515_00018168, partial [Chloebia gouldiae]